MIVRIRARDAADRGLALHLHVALVVLDIERGLRGVLDAPHDHGRDLDRIAALVVDLELLAVEVVRAQRDLRGQRLVDDALAAIRCLRVRRWRDAPRNPAAYPRVERVRPVEAALPYRALVRA